MDEWARNTAIRTYGLLFNQGFITQEQIISYLRSLIYEKLSLNDTEVVFTAIADCIIDSKLYPMIPDALFLHENDRVDTSYHGHFDGFIDWLFYENESNASNFIEDIVKELERWSCYKKNQDGDKPKIIDLDGGSGLFDTFEELFMREPEAVEKILHKQNEANQNISHKQKKVRRNDPCHCGSGKKYKNCCYLSDQKSLASGAKKTDALISRPRPSFEDKFDLPVMYPKGSPIFNEMYDAEAINIDMRVYKALDRFIHEWEKWDLKQEQRIEKIYCLNDALELFLEKCRRESITSFSDYDDRHMIHYRSSVWISELVDLIERDDALFLKDIGRAAEDVIKMFS